MFGNWECVSHSAVKPQRSASIWNAFPGAMKFVALAVAITGMLGIVTPAHSQESERPPENVAARAKANVLIESMLKEREKIISATVQVRGSQVFRRNDPPPERTIRGMYAFDHSQELFRFDSLRRMRIRMITPAVRAAAGNNLKAAMALAEEEDVDTPLRYLRTRDLSAWWSKSSPKTMPQCASGRLADSSWGVPSRSGIV